MNAETREYRDHAEGTVRRILLQYAFLGDLLNAGASAVSYDTMRRLGGAEIVRLWYLTVGVVMSGVDRDMRVHGASRAVGMRLVGNCTWLQVANSLGLTILGAKNLYDETLSKLYAEIVGRDLSEDYRHAA